MDGVKVNGVAVLVIASQAFVYEGEESLGPACLDERRNKASFSSLDHFSHPFAMQKEQFEFSFCYAKGAG